MTTTMTTTMYYTDAFDEEVMNLDASFDWQHEEYHHVPVEDWAAEMEQAELAGKTFYNDETGNYEVVDEEEEEKENVEPSPRQTKEVPIIAPPKVSVWTNVTTTSITVSAEFPPLGTLPPKTKKTVFKRQKMIPLKLEIKIRHGPSAIIMKEKEKKVALCKFVVEGKRCPHKVCRFVHPK